VRNGQFHCNKHRCNCVGSNLLTSRLQGWWNKRAITTKARTAKQLREEMELVTRLHSSMEQMFVYTVTRLIWAFIFVLLGFLLALLTMVFSGYYRGLWDIAGVSMTALSTFYALNSLIPIVSNLSKAAKFDEYKVEAEKRLAEIES